MLNITENNLLEGYSISDSDYALLVSIFCWMLKCVLLVPCWRG